MRKAAETLAEMVFRAVGCRLETVTEEDAGVYSEAAYEIVIGTTGRDTDAVRQARASLKNDGYALIVENGRLFITGRIARGAGYGVYSLLEDYVGVRFYTSDYTVIHEAERVQIPGDLNISFSPPFEYRDVNWFDYLKNPDFAARNKVNSTLGRRTDVPGGMYYAGGGFVHTLHSPCVEEGEPQRPEQPCLTDEEVYRRVLANVKKLIEKDPGAPIVSVSQNDSGPEGLGCQCPRCRVLDEEQGTPMGSLLTFVNRIARDLRKEYPDVVVDTLAYRYTRKAPATLIPEENVAIRLCSIECCFSHPLNDDGCEDNLAFRNTLKEWAKICKRLYIWDYTTDFAHYLTPFPNLNVLWENVRFFRENNVAGIHEQGNLQARSGEFGELRAYLLAKLLWNPDMERQEYDALMDEFLRDYYGPGWRSLRGYIDRTSAKAAEHHLHIYDSPDEILPVRETSREQDLIFAREMTGLWEKALEAAENGEQRAHVEKSRLQDEYYNLYTNFDGQTQRNERLYRAIRKHNITHHYEAGIPEGATTLPELTDFNIPPRLWKKR